MNAFQSEAYRNFLESHTQLNNYIKISTVAVDYLYNSANNNNQLSNTINDLILQSGERWTPRIIKNPKQELMLLKNNLTKSAIVWVYSAFDVFFKQTEGVLSSTFIKAENDEKDVNNDDDKKNGKILELYRKLNWHTNTIDELLHILKFYGVLRNLIAHNIGKPSDKLIEIASCKEFQDAIANWKTKYVQKKISPPPIVKGDIIELKPHHAIIYSETCLRIAEDINQRVFGHLGLKFFVDKTLKKHLFEPKVLTAPACMNLTKYLIFHLKNDYNISVDSYGKITNLYKEEEMKEYKRRYNALKNK